MGKSKLLSLSLSVSILFLFAAGIWANIPAPPTNQQIGIPDTVYENLQEADCRLCHENPDQFPVDDESIPNRHHLLYAQPIPENSAVPNPDANNDSIPDTHYGCLSCHNQDSSGGIITFLVETECMVCHMQIGDSTVHHLTPPAQAGDCVHCHGDIVDNMDDGHIIPAYEPSLVTPKPSGGDGLPLNSRGKAAGACDYCHDDGISDEGVIVKTNMEAHHGTGFYAQGKCNWCHTGNFAGGCVGCHSSEQGDLGLRRQIAGSGGDFEMASHHIGQAVSDSDCMVCHDMTYHLDGDPDTIPDPQVYLRDPDGGASITYDGTGESLETFCINCHDENGANGDSTPFSDEIVVPNVKGVAGSLWKDSAHAVQGYSENGGNPVTCFGDGVTTGCHVNGHGSNSEKLLSAVSTIDQFCFNCHTEGMVVNDAISNNRPGGYVSADDIEEAFAKSTIHNLGTSFTLGNNDFTLQCTTCHNPHVATGKYWDAEAGLSPITRPDFSDPVNNPRAMGNTLWGASDGEKIDDFAAQGAGTGGFYYNIALGYSLGATGLTYNQPAVYQPPKSGNGYNFEFGGDVLPDYTSLCLDCHTYRVNESIPPVNWGQGIACTDNSLDPPNQRIECGAQHGLASAGKPLYMTDDGTAGFWGTSGNPDVIFHMNYVTRGRGSGHFMRWPYDSADRNAGINFVMSCTDCHEAHGSDRGGMIRERFNVNANGDCGSGGDTDPNGESCADGSNWNSMCNACHYYYGGQHAGMSCGTASCHEANSLHRIIHTTDSGASTQLMITDRESDPEGNPWSTFYQRPDFTPEIETVESYEGSAELIVTFKDGVWTNMDLTGALKPGDFWLFDINNDNPRYITDVIHTPGEATATIVMNMPLIAADLYTDILATTGKAVWNWYDGGYENWATGIIDAQAVSAGPWPMRLNTTSDGCPVTADFRLDESAGSAAINDESGLLEGTVNNSAAALPGDGYFHGDETQDTYIEIDNTNLCLMSPRELTIEARIKPTKVDADYGNGTTPDACTSDYDCDAGGTVSCSCGRDTTTDRNDRCPGDTGGCDTESGYYFGCTSGYQSSCPVDEVCCPNPGEGCWNNTGFCTTASENATFSRIFERKRNIKITVIHTEYRGDNTPGRAGKASIEVKYFVDTDSRHDCPHEQWPDDEYTGADARWHQISSSIDEWPLLDNHWYKVKVVFNSNKTDGPPVDIYIDDQGDGVDEAGTQLWDGYVNASKSINDSSSCKWGALPGDFIASESQYSYIGSAPNYTQLFDGLIDWVTWQPVADYSDVVPPPSSVSSFNAGIGQPGFGGILGTNDSDNTGGYDNNSNLNHAYNNESEIMTNEGTTVVQSDPEIPAIRVCEGCHGYESLHNIQADTDGDDIIQPGVELPGYGHIGDPDECWGCHGFAMASASAPGSGILIPHINNSDLSVITAGSDTLVTLTGSAFTNLSDGGELLSSVLLTAVDGSSVTLEPESITQGVLTVIIPGTTVSGSYTLHAVKNGTISNPVSLSITPGIEITDVDCSKCLGTMTLTGSGFSEKPEGTDDYISVEEGGRPLNVISWTDTQIQVSGARCSGEIRVNTLFGSKTR